MEHFVSFSICQGDLPSSYICSPGLQLHIEIYSCFFWVSSFQMADGGNFSWDASMEKKKKSLVA